LTDGAEVSRGISALVPKCPVSDYLAGDRLNIHFDNEKRKLTPSGFPANFPTKEDSSVTKLAGTLALGTLVLMQN